jgi:hypothetical protein
LCCPSGKDDMHCRANANRPCCYKGGVKVPIDTDDQECCSGFLLPNGVCADE